MKGDEVLEIILSSSINKILGISFLAAVLLLGVISPNYAAAKESKVDQEKFNAVAESVFYNTQTKLYEFDLDIAKSEGLSSTEASRIKGFFESLTVEEVAEINNEIGFSPEQNAGENGTYALPLVLIPIAKFIVGAAGAVIVGEVTLYGIGKACKNLK